MNAVDKYGNLNPDYRGSTYSLSSDSQAILPQDYLFTAQDAGSHVFNATFKTAGMHDITIIDNRGPRGTQSDIVVEALKPSLLILDKFTSQNPQSTQVTTPFLKPLSVVLTDMYGNPQSGYTVTFSVPASGASANLTGADTQVIGSDGKASVLAAANTFAGSYALLVTTDAPGVAPFTFSLTNLPGPASALSYDSGSPQVTPLAKSFAAPLVVRVADAYGNPVSGAWVTFTAPASGPGCVLPNAGQAQSGADGLARLVVEANHFAGTYQVEARLPGVTNPVFFTLTNLAFYYLPIITLNYPGG